MIQYLQQLYSSYFTLPRTRWPVRHMFPVLLVGVAVLSASAVVSTERSYISLNPSQSRVAAGDRFSIQVSAYAHEPVNAVDVTLHFNPQQVQVLSIDRGQSVITLWPEEPRVDGNLVRLQGGTYRRGFIGEHELVTLELEAQTSGVTYFNTDEILFLSGDGTASEVALTDSDDTQVSVLVLNQDGSTPETIAANARIELITDITNDGKVTLQDISAFMAAWNDRSVTYDFNNDGRMTFRDFSIILAAYFFR